MPSSCVRWLLRTEQAYCEQLCEKDTLDFGIAFHSARYASLPEANQFREVVIDDAARCPMAVEQAQAFFQERGLACHVWAPANGVAPHGLADLLASRGFVRTQWVAMRFGHWTELEPAEGIRVLPARPLREAYRETCLATAPPESDASLFADAHNARLDDPQMDMFVALAGERPVARGGLYQVGDIGRILAPTAVGTAEGRNAVRAILRYTLTIVRRLTLKHVCCRIDRRDEESRALLASAGFAPDGEIEEFVRPHASDSQDITR